jgi:hypothetical protein
MPTNGIECRELWKIPAEHVLYREDGTFYMPLERFPGALCDANGYILFKTERDYKECPQLRIGVRVDVPKGIAQIPGYVRARGGGTIDKEAEDAIETTFTLERDLQKALREHIQQLDDDLRITDGGKERIVASGRIDITAEDKQGAVVVIELKSGEADRSAVGQLLSYMGDLLAEDASKAVRGILVAPSFRDSVVAAARAVPSLQLKKYSIRFSFEDANQ